MSLFLKYTPKVFELSMSGMPLAQFVLCCWTLCFTNFCVSSPSGNVLGFIFSACFDAWMHGAWFGSTLCRTAWRPSMFVVQPLPYMARPATFHVQALPYMAREQEKSGSLDLHDTHANGCNCYDCSEIPLHCGFGLQCPGKWPYNIYSTRLHKKKWFYQESDWKST